MRFAALLGLESLAVNQGAQAAVPPSSTDGHRRPALPGPPPVHVQLPERTRFCGVLRRHPPHRPRRTAQRAAVARPGRRRGHQPGVRAHPPPLRRRRRRSGRPAPRAGHPGGAARRRLPRGSPAPPPVACRPCRTWPHLDRKMSDAEGLMWRLENDPFLSSAFANITILDRPSGHGPAAAPPGTGDRRVPAAAPSGPARAGQPRARRRGWTTRPSTCTTTSATSPCPSRARCANCSIWPA